MSYLPSWPLVKVEWRHEGFGFYLASTRHEGKYISETSYWSEDRALKKLSRLISYKDQKPKIVDMSVGDIKVR